jgi:light-regulated signal transduction histidine kinase (bacteriophytochrome)
MKEAYAEKGYFETVFIMKRKDGTPFDSEHLVTPVIDDSGEIVRHVCVVRNISERKKFEEKIKKLNNELECRVTERTAELERMNTELEGFCYAISHEFRAPIARMEGFASMLIEAAGLSGDEQILHCSNRIVAASNRLRTVIDSLLTMNRLSRADMTLLPVNLSEMSLQIVAELLEQNEGRAVTVTIAPDIIVQGDRYMLEICMRNLLGNALKYTSKTTDASIEFGKQRLEGVDTCFVRDNGVGFDMKFVKNLFVPFCRLHTEAEFEGTGVGLATVHRIIEKHGGRIWAEAEPDKGATFFFTL